MSEKKPKRLRRRRREVTDEEIARQHKFIWRMFQHIQYLIIIVIIVIIVSLLIRVSG